jgi:hypothetical protein
MKRKKKKKKKKKLGLGLGLELGLGGWGWSLGLGLEFRVGGWGVLTSVYLLYVQDGSDKYQSVKKEGLLKGSWRKELLQRQGKSIRCALPRGQLFFVKETLETISFCRRRQERIPFVWYVCLCTR